MPSPLSPTVVQRRKRGNKGIVRAIYAVTGVVDEVNDLIIPGSFARTLSTRRVKAVWHHEWKDPVGIVLSIEEWLPGDPRFAQIPGGSVWPKGAGALVATVQYNLRTTRGRDAYEQVKQWHDAGEAQFSIGYKVTTGGASKRHDGVRIIHDLDLYEISPVLHGAHPMTRSIEVKTAKAPPGELERKATWSAVELKTAEQQVGNGVMVALRIPKDVAEKIAHPDGTPAEHLHITLAYLGDVAELGGHPDDLRDIVTSAVRDSGPLTGSIGGIGRFPDSGDGAPTWVPVDVPGLSELQQTLMLALSTSVYSDAVRNDHGFTPHVTLGYDMPDIDPVPSTPVTFDTVLVVRGGDEWDVPLGEAPAEEPTNAPDAPTRPPSPEAREFAKNVMRTYSSLPMEGKSAARIVVEAKVSGGWDANEGNAENLRRWYSHGGGAARIGWGSPGDFDRCVAIASEHMSPEDAKGYCNLRHHDAMGIYPATHAAAEHKSAAQVVLEAKSAQPVHLPERIMTTPMPYSFEQLREQLGRSVRSLFAPDRDDESSGPTQAPECYVTVEATYPDHVIVTRYDDGDTQSYSVPYTASGRDVDLGAPVPVELTTVATPISGVERETDEEEATEARFIQPTGRALDDAATLITVSDAGPKHLEHLKPAVGRLLAALSKKGMPMDDSARPKDGEDDWLGKYTVTDGWDDDEDPSVYDDYAEDSDSTPGGDGAIPYDDDPDDGPDDDPDTEPDDDPDDQGNVRLNASEVKAALAELAL